MHIRNNIDLEKYAANTVQVKLGAGDFLVWDSRLVHANQGIDPRLGVDVVMKGRERSPLVRLVAYVAMVPTAHIARRRDAVEVFETRKAFINKGLTSGHNPFLGKSEVKDETKHRNRTNGPLGYKRPSPSNPCWELL